MSCLTLTRFQGLCTFGVDFNKELACVFLRYKWLNVETKRCYYWLGLSIYKGWQYDLRWRLPVKSHNASHWLYQCNDALTWLYYRTLHCHLVIKWTITKRLQTLGPKLFQRPSPSETNSGWFEIRKHQQCLQQKQCSRNIIFNILTSWQLKCFEFELWVDRHYSSL